MCILGRASLNTVLDSVYSETVLFGARNSQLQITEGSVIELNNSVLNYELIRFDWYSLQSNTDIGGNLCLVTDYSHIPNPFLDSYRLQISKCFVGNVNIYALSLIFRVQGNNLYVERCKWTNASASQAETPNILIGLIYGYKHLI